MLAWWKFIYGGFVLNVTVSVLLYHRVFDLIFSVGMTNNNKKRHVDESWERQKKQALLLYRSVNNSLLQGPPEEDHRLRSINFLTRVTNCKAGPSGRAV